VVYRLYDSFEDAWSTRWLALKQCKDHIAMLVVWCFLDAESLVIKVKHMEIFEDEGGVGDALEPINKVVQCKVDLRANTTSLHRSI